MSDNKFNISIEEIESIEQLEDFNDEYVYDLEVEDSHMFFANDILAHNSIYFEFLLKKTSKSCYHNKKT